MKKRLRFYSVCLRWSCVCFCLTGAFTGNVGYVGIGVVILALGLAINEIAREE